MINYEASAINSNITLLEKMNKIEKYLLENQLGNVFVTYQTLADDRLSDSDIEELNDRIIGKGDLLIDNDGYLYVITGFNEHTIYIDFNNRIKLGDRLDQAELDQIQQMINDTLVNLDPITISTSSVGVRNNIAGNNTIAIGESIRCDSGDDPQSAYKSVLIGNDIGTIHNSVDTFDNEKNVGIGNEVSIRGSKCVAIGYNTEALKESSIAIGDRAHCGGTNACQIGNGTNADDNSLKFKNTTIVDGNGNIAIKYGGTAGQVLTKQSSNDNDYNWQNFSIDTSIKNLNPIIIGSSDDSTDDIEGVEPNSYSIGIGANIDCLTNDANVTPTKSILIGYGHNIQRATNNTNFIDNILIGDSCWVREGDNNIMIGKDCIIQGIYQDNDIASNSITIGNTNETHGNDNILIGHNNTTNSTNKINNVLIGTNCSSSDDNNIAIGNTAIVNTTNACQIGYGTNTTANSLQYRSTTIIDTNGKLSIPNGLYGTTGQVLTKMSNAENDYEWQTPQGGGGGATGKTFNIPVLMNYNANESFNDIINTPTTIVIDDQQTMQGLNLETQDADFTDYENETSMYLYTYMDSNSDYKVQIVYGVIAESSTPGTYEFTGLMALAPEITA